MHHSKLLLAFALMLAPVTVTACGQSQGMGEETQTLAAARAGFTTKVQPTRDGSAAPEPPKGVLERIHYPAPLGSNVGYLTPRPKTAGRHPAVIWISGGDSNTIGSFWDPQDPANDQTASAFRDAGIVTFYPSLRGGNDNPGSREGFYGEIDDVLAAADYLAKLDYVDPARIYLAGHSTGGTMVLLAAEMSGRFRSVFSFGPVADVRNYAGEFVYADSKDDREMKLRSPGLWLSSVRSPVFVFEGAGRGNVDELEAMRRSNRNPHINFFAVEGRDHFSILAPVTALVAKKIVADTAGKDISFDQAELDAAGR
ncbi:prolyl oligopeptidase family serine peptidase [Sphingomonas sp. ZT3P38]|uniref:alpha/beta hydrolase family protein n=1 Tax=Parasphingomonas zepuensis TaxID=3096161 RepID=UPI002FC899A1